MFKRFMFALNKSNDTMWSFNTVTLVVMIGLLNNPAKGLATSIIQVLFGAGVLLTNFYYFRLGWKSWKATADQFLTSKE